MKGIRQFSLLLNKGNCLLFFLVFHSFLSFGQDTINKPLIDSSNFVVGDTLKEIKFKKPHSPKKAALFSAVIPGLGQVYNRKYWKVPIIYAGFGGLGYLFFQNNKEFTYYRDILVNRADTTISYIDPLPNISNEQIYSYREDFRRYRDLCFVGMFAIYVLNIVDASVDAHLFTFDVSEDLSLNIRPYALPAISQPSTAGLTFTLNFR